MTAESRESAAAVPPGTERIEIRVGEMKQLFNAMDPAPFRERDLDPKAEAFIVEAGRESRADAPLALVVQLGREAPTAQDVRVLREAVTEHFARCAAAERTRLRRLFRTGRWSLLIGVAFVAAALLIGERVADLVGRYDYGKLIQESVAIGAWVALWRPMEIFLYDWWPIRAEARLYDRLAAMSVRLVGAEGGSA